MPDLYTSGVPPEEVVLFIASSVRIVQNLKAVGVELNNDEPEYIQAYRWMCANRGMAMGEGRRVNLCRFGGLPRAIVNHVDQWAMDCFERS